jgi:glycosyltransferase involved in cell wall biosynthesis
MSAEAPLSAEENVNPAPAAPAVTVIVPVRNGGRDLVEVLEALVAQTLPRERFEVVIGDDGSSDGATEGLANENAWVRVSVGPPANEYVARNRAAALARGSILVFCDADCRPEPNWLEAGLAAMSDADVAGGLIRLRAPARRTVWTILDMEMHIDQRRAVAAGRGLTGNLFVRRSVFERVGGFDGSLPSGGDYEFVSRALASGARLRLASDAVVWHPTHDAAKPFLRKLWKTQWSNGVRDHRRGERPRLLTRTSIPILGVILSRRRIGRPLGLDRPRLLENGVRPTPWEQLRALPVAYVLVPQVVQAARLRGWWMARRVSHDP